MMLTRSGVAALVLFSGILVTHEFSPKLAPGLSRPLRELPSIAGYSRIEDRPFENDVVEAIGADDYVNRAYLGSAPPIELFIGYYKDQRSGDKIHSPKNCLPRSGWEPVRSTRVQIGTAGISPLLVNEYLVAKGSKRDMVLYWYQGHGRVVASEYLAKVWLVVDGLKQRSPDGAMIRIWTSGADGEQSAHLRAVNFARQVYPLVAGFLPN